MLRVAKVLVRVLDFNNYSKTVIDGQYALFPFHLLADSVSQNDPFLYLTVVQATRRTQITYCCAKPLQIMATPLTNGKVNQLPEQRRRKNTNVNNLATTVERYKVI